MEALMLKDPGCMTAAQEAAFEKKADAYFRGHRGLPNGRNFRCWNHTPSKGEVDRYRDNYDKIKWN
jgi:hypothetical protein